MPKHVGIVACSSEGAALCYRTLCLEAAETMGVHRHPEVTMHTHCLADYMQFVRTGDWDGVASLMLSSAEKAARAGADFFICPDNTIHEALPKVIPRSPRPWIHIADEVAKEAGRREYRHLAVLGTRYLMEGPVYREALAAHHLEAQFPNEAERVVIDDTIFGELVKGRFTPAARARFSSIIDALKSRGCDAVVLGCTEIPLLVSQADSSLPLLDSTRLLARAALAKAVTE
jgi:aspartate racemase